MVLKPALAPSALDSSTSRPAHQDAGHRVPLLMKKRVRDLRQEYFSSSNPSNRQKFLITGFFDGGFERGSEEKIFGEKVRKKTH